MRHLPPVTVSALFYAGISRRSMGNLPARKSFATLVLGVSGDSSLL